MTMTSTDPMAGLRAHATRTWSADAADDLVTHLVPDPAQLLTKDHLDLRLAIELGTFRGEVRADMADLRIELRTGLADLRTEIATGLTDNQFPVAQAQLERVYNDLRRPYLPLPQDTAERLRQIHADKEAYLATAADWQLVISDLAQKRVLLYLNGTEWYDVHPLLREPLAAQSPALVTPA